MIGNLRSEIDRRLARGASLGEIDHRVLETHGELSEDERSALWLYAWLQSPEEQPLRHERDAEPDLLPVG